MRRWTVLIGLSMACGEAAPVVPNPDLAELLPVAVGNRWTYRVTSSSAMESTKVQTVTGTMAVDGLTAHVFETARGKDKETRSVQLVKAGSLFRVSEEAFDEGRTVERVRYEPFALRIDSKRTTANASYTDMHEKLLVDASGGILARESRTHVFTVEAEKELVTVPAGTYECVRVRRDDNDGSSKMFWYAPRVGKVKETGGQTEELVRVEMAPGS